MNENGPIADVLEELITNDSPQQEETEQSAQEHPSNNADDIAIGNAPIEMSGQIPDRKTECDFAINVQEARSNGLSDHSESTAPKVEKINVRPKRNSSLRGADNEVAMPTPKRNTKRKGDSVEGPSRSKSGVRTNAKKLHQETMDDCEDCIIVHL